MNLESNTESNNPYRLENYKDILKNNYVRTLLLIGGGILIVFIGGKVMRIMAGTVTEYKMLKTAIKQ
jgi:hypothetical protein